MYFPIKLPPGIKRNGTEYESKGRYYDAYLVRWTEDGTLKSIGGWRTRASGTVTGMARAIMAWKDNSEVTWLIIGTHSNLYASNRAGSIFDITPSGFTSGHADASAGGGYGAGNYSSGTYGTPRPDTSLVTDATEWTFDTFGQIPLGVSPDDGFIYEWDLNTAHIATKTTNAPTCKAVVVTPERFVFALGAVDPRSLSWCDQANRTVWTPSSTNQAGAFTLQSQGRLMCGKALQGGTLLLTDLDAWMANYIGGTLVYGFEKIASACGAVSRQCVAAMDSNAVWMGKTGFWLYNGFVRPLECDVLDYVFSDINLIQVSKIYAVRDAANSEVQWYYCSSSATEIDRCVVWNYKFNYWNIGRIARTCGTDRGVFTYPVFVDSGATSGSAGLIYEHEVGLSYDSTFPYAEGGPIELGNGDRVMSAQWLIPDDKTLGDVTATFKIKYMPDDSEVSVGPYTLSARTGVRFEGRQTKVRFTGARLADWRVGAPRLDLTAGGQR